jgi:three-Cys-motif partner protein
MDGGKAEALRKNTQGRQDVFVYEGDCNKILLNSVFPRARYENFRRALCLLDPYGLHLNWEVIETAGRMRSVEIFLNFPVMDMNMNVLWKNPDKIPSDQAERMTAYWGDRSWRDAAYAKSKGLFHEIEEKRTNEAVAEAFQKRLGEVAKFKFVPDPVPMRNSRGVIVYFLFFASPNQTGARIVQDIFEKYRNKGA